jgi:hypothetical protein
MGPLLATQACAWTIRHERLGKRHAISDNWLFFPVARIPGPSRDRQMIFGTSESEQLALRSKLSEGPDRGSYDR